ncbi:MAG: uridine kinase [Spirochaetota bacterium]
MKAPIIIGIAGASGSGKTSVRRAIIKSLKEEVSFIKHDSYYKDITKLDNKDEYINFDHPESLETSLFIEHLKTLKQNVPVQIPTYDYKTNRRKEEKVLIRPTKVIIVEGILLYVEEELRNLLDIKIFVDTDLDECILRRIKRDVKERGRTLDSVVDQYLKTVKPMFHRFVEPSKRYADISIHRGGKNKVGIDLLVNKIKNLLLE